MKLLLHIESMIMTKFSSMSVILYALLTEMSQLLMLQTQVLSG